MDLSDDTVSLGVSLSSSSSMSVSSEESYRDILASSANRRKLKHRLEQAKIKRRRSKMMRTNPYPVAPRRALPTGNSVFATKTVRDSTVDALRKAHQHVYGSLHTFARNALLNAEPSSLDSIAAPEECHKYVEINPTCAGAIVPTDSKKNKWGIDAPVCWGDMNLNMSHACGFFTSEDVFEIFDALSALVNGEKEAAVHLRMTELVYRKPGDESVQFGQANNSFTARLEITPGSEPVFKEMDSDQADRVEELHTYVSSRVGKDSDRLGLEAKELFDEAIDAYCVYASKAGMGGAPIGADMFSDVKLLPVMGSKGCTTIMCICNPLAVDMLKIAHDVWPDSHFWLCVQTNTLCVVLGDLPMY